MQHSESWRHSPFAEADPPLSSHELAALKQACAPVGLLSFPPPDVIRTLRLHGYVKIVLGGVQITPLGLERLLRERRQAKPKLCE